MCSQLTEQDVKVVASYRKGNLPGGTAYLFREVTVGLCKCGKLWGRIPDGQVWVEMEVV